MNGTVLDSDDARLHSGGGAAMQDFWWREVRVTEVSRQHAVYFTKS